jgi:predicted RNA binding protein YcfA (HicA-like mRNA interferase family)
MFQERARRALERLGFVFKRQNGSHVVLRRGNRGCVVPMHREISRGTLQGILEQAGISVEEFMEAL